MVTVAAGAISRIIEITFASSQASEFINTFVDVNKQVDSLKFKLDLVTSSSFEASEKFDLLKKSSYNLGLDIIPLGGAYAKLLEAVKGTNIEGATTDKLFLGIASAASKLGLDGVVAERALKAVEQIASKGKVSLEEVRGQLGDAIPGAVPIFAQAAGVTVDEFFKLVEQGKITSEVLDGVADILISRYGDGSEEVKTLTAAIGRLDNELTLLLGNIGDLGVKDVLVGIFDAASGAIKTANENIIDFKDFITDISDLIEKENYELLFSTISDGLKNALDKLPDVFKNYGPGSSLIDAISTLSDLIALELIPDLIGYIKDKDWLASIETLVDFVNRAFEIVNLSPLIQTVADIGEGIADSFIGQLATKLAAGDFEGALKQVGDFFSNYGPGSDLLQAAKDLGDRVANSVLPDIADALSKGDFGTAIDLIVTELESAFKDINLIPVLSTITSIGESISNGLIGDIVKKITDGDFSGAASAISTALENALTNLSPTQEIKDVLNSFAGLFQGDFSNAIKVAFTDGNLQPLKNTISTAISDLFSDSGSAANQATTAAENLGGDIVDALANGISSGGTGTAPEDLLSPAFQYLNEFEGLDVAIEIQKTEDALKKAGEKAKELSDNVKDANSAFQVLGSKQRLDDLGKIKDAFNELATNPAVNSDDFFTVWNTNLRKFVDNPEGINILSGAISTAYSNGKITAEEATSAYGTLQLAQDGVLTKVFKLQDEFKNLNTKSQDNAGLKKKGSVLDELKGKADSYQKKLQALSKDQSIKLIEATVKLKIAEAEANAKILEGIFDSLKGTIESTGNVLSSIFGAGGAFASGVRDRTDAGFDILKEQVDKENKLRQDAFDLQKSLTEAQIASITAKTAAIQSGASLIKIDGAGLQPHLEAFMWEILRTIQVRVAADGLDLLLGGT
jgi:tape measure domain-containing protein